jgi:hypothetical protein
MFERFRRNDGENGRGAVAVQEREPVADRTTVAPPPTDTVREREPVADRTTVAPPPTDTVRERDVVHEREPLRDRGVLHEREPMRDRDIERDEDRDRLVGPSLDRDDVRAMRARQRDRFGGFSWGSDFFGWLTAVGLASILTALLVAAGAAIGLSEIEDAAAQETAETVSLTGGLLLLGVLAIGWFAGGYVAGRMARFDGARQGVGVWLWTIVAVIAVALLAAIGGREYDLLEQLNLPRIPVGEETLTTGGAIALAAALLTTLVAAMLGGKLGERFHRRVDREAITG